MVIAKGSERYRKHRQRIRGIGRMLATAIKQHRQVNILRQSKNAKNKTQHHKNNQHYGNAINRAGGMPDECAEDNDKQNGRPFAVQPNQRRQNHASGCNVGIKKNAANEINSNIVDGIGAAAKHIVGDGIEGYANVIAFVGFEQHPAGKGHDHHRDQHGETRPQCPRTRTGAWQTEHSRADADAGDNAGTAKNGRLFVVHGFILFE